MKLRQTIPLFAIAALSIGLTSCGGSGSNTTPATGHDLGDLECAAYVARHQRHYASYRRCGKR